MFHKFLVHSLKFIVIILLFFLLPTLNSELLTVHAQVASPSALPSSLSPIPSQISPTSPIYTDMLLHNMFHTFSCIAVGSSVIGQPCLTYQASKDAQGNLQSIPVLSQANLSGGILGTTTSLLGAIISTPPIHTTNYLASVGESLGIVKEAHAQVVGTGANVLDPVLKLWQVSRNIAYVLMVVIFIVIGMMIMFRNKLNPQTVITAQAALPGLVIGLILITFSYFLAALISDTAFIGTNLVGSYFSAATDKGTRNLSADLESKSVTEVVSKFIGSIRQGQIHNAVGTAIDNLGSSPSKVPGSIVEMPGVLVENSVSPSLIIRTIAAFLSYQYVAQFAELPALVFSGTTCAALAALAAANPGWLAGIPPITMASYPTCVHNGQNIVKQTAGIAAGAIGYADPATPISWAIFFILTFVLIYTMIKLLFRLVTCFLSIVFYTTTAPFYFLFSALPGRQGIATGWIMSMLANILAFPAVIAVLYFVNYLLGSAASDAFPVGAAVDLSAKSSFPLLGGMTADFIRTILAIGALLATPTIPDVVQRALGAVSQAGQMIGNEITGGFRSGRGYATQAQHEASRIHTGGLFDQRAYVGKADEDGHLVGVESTYDPRYGGKAGGARVFGARIKEIFGKGPIKTYKP